MPGRCTPCRPQPVAPDVLGRPCAPRHERLTSIVPLRLRRRATLRPATAAASWADEGRRAAARPACASTLGRPGVRSGPVRAPPARRCGGPGRGRGQPAPVRGRRAGVSPDRSQPDGPACTGQPSYGRPVASRVDGEAGCPAPRGRGDGAAAPAATTAPTWGATDQDGDVGDPVPDQSPRGEVHRVAVATGAPPAAEPPP